MFLHIVYTSTVELLSKNQNNFVFEVTLDYLYKVKLR